MAWLPSCLYFQGVRGWHGRGDVSFPPLADGSVGNGLPRSSISLRLLALYQGHKANVLLLYIIPLCGGTRQDSKAWKRMGGSKVDVSRGEEVESTSRGVHEMMGARTHQVRGRLQHWCV